MNQRAADAGVEQLLIMVDGEGSLGHAENNKRQQAIDNHDKWIAAAVTLGCHSIRVNAAGKGEASEVAARATDSLRTLAERGAEVGINILVENHGGHSSNGAWLAGVMAAVDHPNCGTLPDFVTSPWRCSRHRSTTATRALQS